MDAFGTTLLTLFAMLLAMNQVVVKLTNTGFGPVFQAGLRSAGAVLVLLLWMRLRGIPLHLPRAAIWPGLLAGVLFGVEFIFLFTALDLTTVSRASVIFYSMPVWLALAAHVLIPEERLTRVRVIGLVLAMAGVALALLDGQSGGGGLTGDLLALGAAMGWAAIALIARSTGLREARPEMQLLVQVAVSMPILMLVAFGLGDLLRDPGPWHLAGLGFQIVFVVSGGFLMWFWLLTIYPAASVASFSFLSPVFSVLLGWLLLREQIGPEVWVALVLVAAGIWLINRR